MSHFDRRSYSSSSLSGAGGAPSSVKLLTVRRQIETGTGGPSSPYRPAPFGVSRRGPLAEIRPLADDSFIGDMPYEDWPRRIYYCDVYKRKWIGYNELHKYWRNPFGWERGLPRFSIGYTPADSFRSFKRYRYVINPPLVRVP